jgi:hypothetical protein
MCRAWFAGLEVVNDDVSISATSPTDMWTFPLVENPLLTGQYAVHDSAGTFTSDSLASNGIGFSSSAALSPADVWAFGQQATDLPGPTARRGRSTATAAPGRRSRCRELLSWG